MNDRLATHQANYFVVEVFWCPFVGEAISLGRWSASDRFMPDTAEFWVRAYLEHVDRIKQTDGNDFYDRLSEECRLLR
jgi:hypothetical protein